MSETILKDRYGRIIGKIKEKRDGILELRDKYGRLVGKGNLLSMFLAEESDD